MLVVLLSLLGRSAAFFGKGGRGGGAGGRGALVAAAAAAKPSTETLTPAMVEEAAKRVGVSS